MPNIKISELSAPIAVTDSDLIPGVQSGVTRRLTWGGLKSTLAGALGRSYLGLGNAAVANVTASATDTTAGRVLKVGDFALPTDSNYRALHAPSLLDGSTDLNTITKGGAWGALVGDAPGSRNANHPDGQLGAYGTANFYHIHAYSYATNCSQFAMPYVSMPTPGAGPKFRLLGGGVWSAWQSLWGPQGENAITVDTGSFGYGVGSGGTVTQGTSKTTAVTLNKPSGQITTASDAIAANSAVSFTLTNNKIAANDIPKVVIQSGATAGAYVVQVDAVAAGSCRISIRNMTAGSLSETLVLQFNIEKGATA